MVKELGPMTVIRLTASQWESMREKEAAGITRGLKRGGRL
jgi:hypothetical protein